MTTKREYDKKKLIILRAVLTVLGGSVCALALWQYFVYYPDVVRSEFKIVITVVSSVFFAAILALSAKPFYRLGAGIGESIIGVANRLGAKGIAAVVLGMFASGVFVFVVDVVMSMLQNIWAVRLLVDVLVYIVFAALCCYAFTKWLTVTTNEPSEDVAPADKGYLITAGCLTDERVLTAVDTLINIRVCEGAYKALCVYYGNADAVKRLDSLVSLGAVTLIRSKAEFAGEAEYTQLEAEAAKSKRLKLIDLNGLNAFALPDERVKEKYGDIE